MQNLSMTNGFAHHTQQVEQVCTEFKQDVLRQELERLLSIQASRSAKIAVAVLNPEEQILFGVRSATVWLSKQTLVEHLARHPEITLEDYLKIPNMIKRASVWGGHHHRRYLLLWIDKKPYRAAIKADASGAEAWFLSLVISSKQKPPKGAVQLRRLVAQVGDLD